MIPELLAAWSADGSVVHVEEEPAVPARFADLEPPPPEEVRRLLARAGIERLYAHQVTTIERLRRGDHTMLVAGTSAGKSWAYRLPILEAAVADPTTTALLLFPTKALTRDQLGGFGDALDLVVPAVYDGDTPLDERRWIRRHATVVLTNPDMLHVGILPNHRAWARVLSGLRFVVVDEAHMLRGAFGTHVALTLRRLRRLARRYGADPTFCLTSATIGNPRRLAADLVGTEVGVVEDDASPRGPRTTVVWNPALEDPDAGLRRSALADAARIFAELVARDVSTIMFARSRRGTEIAYRWAVERLDPAHADRVAVYRAGYRPEERRRIERRLFGGELLGVVSTNALELGIDVGGLDAAVLATFPGTIASFRQQAGRAGRGERPALTVLVAGEDALDQWYAANPGELFGRAPEAVVVNPTNPTILDAQLRCAAHELDLRPQDRAYFGVDFEERVTDLVGRGLLDVRDGRVFSPAPRSPASEVDLRGTGGAEYVIVDDAGELLGTVDEERAFSQCHEGAIYLHGGVEYLVERLDLTRREILVAEASVPWHTRAASETTLEVVSEADGRAIGDLTVHHGIVEVGTRVTGYRRIDDRTREVLEVVELDLPERRFTTQAVWYVFPDRVAAEVEPDRRAGAIHAAEHTAIGVLPRFAVCDRWDVGGLSTPWHPAVGAMVFFVYDGVPGGTGIAPIAFAEAERHLAATASILAGCGCRDGCPSCVQSPKCGNFNEPLDRFAALTLVEHWAGR